MENFCRKMKFNDVKNAFQLIYSNDVRNSKNKFFLLKCEASKRGYSVRIANLQLLTMITLGAGNSTTRKRNVIVFLGL